MEEKVLLQATLCFPVKEGKILLAKKMEKIGKGCWNGYGGGIEEGESPEEAAVRELREESGLQTNIHNLEKVAVVDFHNTTETGASFICQVHVYLTRIWHGELKSTDEMTTPTWFTIETLPLGEMMLADREWLPVILRGKKVAATVWYGPRQQTLLRDVEIREVSNFKE